MKKLIASQFIVDPDKLYKLPIRGIDHLQEAYRDTLEQLCRGLMPASYTVPVKLYGVADTITAGPNHAITAGAIYWELSATAWSGATAYLTGQGVSISGYVYAALQASTNKNPTTEPTYWALVGATGEGQIFRVDAISFTPLTDTVVARFATTFISGDPALFTDTTTANVHAIFKIVLVDAATGTGIFDYTTANTFPEKFIEVSGGIGFQNSWANEGAGYNTAAYRKDKNGFVHLKGVIKSGSSNTVAFTLPAGYRPSDSTVNWYFPLVSPGSTEQVYVLITSTGTVKPQFASGSQFSLDGICFPTD